MVPLYPTPSRRAASRRQRTIATNPISRDPITVSPYTLRSQYCTICSLKFIIYAFYEVHAWAPIPYKFDFQSVVRIDSLAQARRRVAVGRLWPHTLRAAGCGAAAAAAASRPPASVTSAVMRHSSGRAGYSWRAAGPPPLRASASTRGSHASWRPIPAVALHTYAQRP